MFQSKSKTSKLRYIPLTIFFIIIIINFKNIVFNINNIIIYTIMFIAIVEFFTKFISFKIKALFIETKNKIDDNFDNQCVFGLFNTIILFTTSYYLIPSETITHKINLTFIILFIYLLLYRITKAYICANINKASDTSPCYPSNIFGKMFCYITQDDYIEDEIIDRKAQPIQAVVSSIQTILFFLALLAIYVFVLGNSIDISFFQSGGLIAFALGLLFKTQLQSMFIGIILVLRKGFYIGDWIEVPELNINGVVIELNSFSVVIENWDKTHTNIPLELFSQKMYKNWEVIKTKNARRIKRSILIDSSSIEYLDDAFIEELKQEELLLSYLEEKQKEITEYNKTNKVKRYLTNIGVYRVYIEKYLQYMKQTDENKGTFNDKINRELTILVRQLDSTEYGIPIEIYAFASTDNWNRYENIQADVFDFMFYASKKFRLRIYQKSN